MANASDDLASTNLLVKIKVRRIDFSPDEWLAGTVELSDAECGVYIRLCALIYSRGGPIPIELLRQACKSHGNAFNAIVTRLEKLGKWSGNDREMMVKRCGNELEKARKRVGNLAQFHHNTINDNDLDGRHGALTRARAEPSTKNHQPSTIEIPSESLTRTRRGARGQGRFEEWWEGNPNKVGKGAARIAYVRALAKTTHEVLAAGVKRYIETKPADRAWCNPATWLNQERWLDEEYKPPPPRAPKPPPSSPPGPLTPDRWEEVFGKPYPGPRPNGHAQGEGT